MRAAAYQALVADEELNALGISEASLFPALGVDSPTIRPFAVLRFGGREVGVGSVVRLPMTLWVYDQGSDFSNIDAILKRARIVLWKACPVVDPVAGWLSAAEWQGDSDDTGDFGYAAITKNSLFILVGQES